MARMKKEFDKDGVFQKRFREQYNKNYRTQEALAEALGVSRPTVVGWLDGKNVPDIISLKRIAKLFNVSADYLLGISEAERSDVNLRAAVEYTGLSEKAVEQIHNGFDYSFYDDDGISDKVKNKNRNIASSLIVNENFIKILNGIRNVSDETYWERMFCILDKCYSEEDEQQENDAFYFANDKDREVCKIILSSFLNSGMILEEIRLMSEHVKYMTDDYIMDSVYRIFLELREKSELHQFHASKAFTGFIDQLIENKKQEAEEKIKCIERIVLSSKPVKN